MWRFRKSKLAKIKALIRNLEGGIKTSDKEAVMRMLRPTIGIKTISIEDNLVKLGGSKIGGRPDLPPEFKWPTINNKPLVFCAQYNLSCLTRLDKEKVLPPKGMFYLFLSLEFENNDHAFRLLYSDSGELTRSNFPAQLEMDYRFKSALIDYCEYYTLPDSECYESYFNVSNAAFTIISNITGVENRHQLLGHDSPVQFSALYDFAAKDLGVYQTKDASEYKKKWEEIEELSKSYQLLLQLDCEDRNSNLSNFGSDGVYFFGISKTDLDAKNFNNLRVAYQCM